MIEDDYERAKDRFIIDTTTHAGVPMARITDPVTGLVIMMPVDTPPEKLRFCFRSVWIARMA